MTTLATLELDYFRAVSLYRRRSYERCAELCNALLQAGHDGHVQLFATKESEHSQEEEEEKAQKEQNQKQKLHQQQAEHENRSRFGSNLQRIGPRPRIGAGTGAGAGADSGASIMMPTWLMEGVWQLKMRALTQRVYLDDLEVDENGDEGESMASRSSN